MKKLRLIAFGIVLCLPKLSQAQDRNGDQELSLSYGVMSGTDLIQGFSKSHARPDADHSTYNVATAKTGNIFLTYRYFINKRLDLGVTLGTESVTFDHNTNYVNEPPVFIGKYKWTITTLAFELKPVYYNGGLIQLYGLIGLGVRYANEKDVSSPTPTQETAPGIPTVFLNSQWTPIGIRIGKTLSGFAEVGIGYKGLANVGISYKLKRRGATAVKKQG